MVQRRKAYYRESKGKDTYVNYLFLSRKEDVSLFPAGKYLPQGANMIKQLISAMDSNAPKTALFSLRDDGSEVPVQTDIVSELSLRVAGLTITKTR